MPKIVKESVKAACRLIGKISLQFLLIAGLGASYAQDCPPVKLYDFPKKDLPVVMDRGLLKQGSSRQYYYGVGVPVDYVKARQLAFIEMDSLGENEDAFEGPSILMMLYANGLGVTRDLDLSIRLACGNVQGAPAELEGRVQHLKDLREKNAKDTFDICDDVTSSRMSGSCAFLRSELAEIARQKRIDSVIGKWSAQEQGAYKKLRAAASAYFDASVESEIDLSGTARTSMQIDASEEWEEDFVQKIEECGPCRMADSSAAAAGKTDKELNALYNRIMKTTKANWGTITKEGIRSTQRLWIRYRDAWVALGAVRCPAVAADTWKALITRERVGQLKDIRDMIRWE